MGELLFEHQVLQSQHYQPAGFSSTTIVVLVGIFCLVLGFGLSCFLLALSPALTENINFIASERVYNAKVYAHPTYF